MYTKTNYEYKKLEFETKKKNTFSCRDFSAYTHDLNLSWLILGFN